MPHINLILNGDGAWKNIDRDKITELDGPIEMTCLTAGMKSGMPSVAIRFDMPDGTYVVKQTSARLFVAAARAMMARWPALALPDLTEAQKAEVDQQVEAAIQNVVSGRAEAREPIPVDRSNVTYTNPVPEGVDHREPLPNDQQTSYKILTEEERAKGFVRQVRRTYLHVGIDPEMSGCVLVKPGFMLPEKPEQEGKRACGTRTTMNQALAETWARDPQFYGGTFCPACKDHFPVAEFVWEGTTEVLGT